MGFKIESNLVGENVIHLDFENQYELTSTFMRLQEFYESPYEGIKGEFFTVEKYMDVYAKEMGNFTYCSDWTGFNVPSDVLEQFLEVFDDHLIDKENDVLKAIGEHTGRMDKFYVIGTYNGSGIDVMKHELAHASYYLDEEYRQDMDAKIADLPTEMSENMIKVLQDTGYCVDVLIDEMQAYLATSDMVYIYRTFGKDVDWEKIVFIQEYFNKHYHKTYGK